MTVDFCLSSANTEVTVWHWEIAQTILYGLRDLGYSAEINLSLYPSAKRNIVFNAHRLPGDFQLNPNSIIYNLEQLYHNSYYLTPSYLKLLQTHEVWDYNLENIKFLKNWGVNAKHLPISYHPCLESIKHQPKDIDVSFVGTMNERRDKLIQSLSDAGINVFVMDGIWHKERDEIYSRSKIALNLHFFEEIKLFEIARVSYLLANKIFVLSEIGHGQEERQYLGGLGFFQAKNLVDACKFWLDSPNLRDQTADRGYHLFQLKKITNNLESIL